MSTHEPYIVSARKYRPATFQSVVGQRALTTTLKNAIQSGKLAQAYLFCGPRGVGKTSCARIFAKTINCLNPTPDGEACGECESCKAIEKGNSFNLVELDAASNNSVDDIRNITDQVYIPAQDGRYRVFIIDEVHMLSNAAFNAFLKTLEEPPKNVVFILATTERHKVIPTIMSRCQVYDFRRITVNDIIDHLQQVGANEGITAEREALGVIALKADGAMRDALSIFDQVAASTQGNVTYQGTLDALNVLDQEYYFKLVDMFRQGDVAGSLLAFKEITDKGFDAQFFINGLADHIRNLMVSADPRTVKLLETSQELEQKYASQAPELPAEWYYAAMKILNDADFNYRLSGNKRLLVELSLIRLARLLAPQAPAMVNDSKPQVSSGNISPSPGPQNRQAPSPAPFAAPDGPKPQAAPAALKEAKSSEEPSRVTEPSPSFSLSPKKGTSTRPTSFRLHSENPNPASPQEIKESKKPFSREDFKNAWAEFAATHPEQRILTAAMRASEPYKVTEESYEVVVDHPAQKQAFDASINELLDFLKQKLENNSITLQIIVGEKTDDEKRLNSKDFLKMVVENNSELAGFLKSIDAELA